MSLTFTDIFCGAGGSSIGLAAAGMELKLAANHWERAIETHSANFRDAEHVCADVNNYDMRRLPTTDILWASPICTEGSPAGGRPSTAKRRPKGQLDMFERGGHVPQPGFERTRATFHDVIRATEVHRYTAVLVENVPEVASRWELFDWWCDGMRMLGYNLQFVSVSSAHVGGDLNPHAPQWRDRLYLVFTRKEIRLPDVDPHPIAYCEVCRLDVAAVQAWKKPGARRIGKYRQQYVYVCPRAECGGVTVEPYILPAAAAIDWSDVGERIGDRPKPLAANTMARISAGLAMFADRHVMITVNHDGHDGRPRPADAAPLPTQTKRIGDGIVSPPMLVPAGGRRRSDGPWPVDLPMRTRLTRESEALVVPGSFLAAAAGHTFERPGSGYHRVWPVESSPMNTRTGTVAEGLVVPAPLYVKQYGGFADPGAMSRPVDGDALGTQTTSDSHSLISPAPFVAVLRNHGTAHGVDEPLRTMTAGGGHHALVIPYRRGNKPTTTADPLHTMATRDSGALVHPAVAVEDCWFRMLKPREQLRAQRFPDSYIVHGNVGEQTMQAGNAVSANVAQWLGERVAAVLGGAR